MGTDYQQLFSPSFLRGLWKQEFDAYLNTDDETVLETLKNWAEKQFQKETTAEGTFVDVFFRGLWNYVASGQSARGDGYSAYPKFPIPGAGQQGGTGEADLAAGWFDLEGVSSTPQVLCEFKDVRSGLDQLQNRKGNNRSPVKQCFDYLRFVAKPLYGNEPVQPTWGVVTDMNEFRLYHYDTGPSQYQRFVINPTSGYDSVSLLESSAEAAFERFLFVRMFSVDCLITRGGQSTLAELLGAQWVQEKALEKDFYEDYHAYRNAIFEAVVEANPQFNGTRGKLVRLTQRFLDRCIFILYCEDMGDALNYPLNLLRDLLQEISTDKFYNADDDAAWTRVKHLFVSMRDGTPFGENQINRFNGGLFEDNPDLDNLKIPTRLFCAKNQTTPRELIANKQTLLYFSATYNFGMHGESGEKTIDLYTLGRIFEQSITDLEKMEAEADDRVSLMKLSKRKSDGVYYTPEWVTYYIVQETVGARINDLKQHHGVLSPPEFDHEALNKYSSWKRSRRVKGKEGPTASTLKPLYRYDQALLRFQDDLEQLKIVDPACGSGAFLIQAFDRLMEERRWVSSELARMEGQEALLFDSETNMRSVLANNIYGVDINPESVEITRLALWLRTALPDRPLTSLDNNIRDGNSLIGSDFYKSDQGRFEFTDDEKERINTFDWTDAFPEVFKRGGFDCVIGNPPYVKLQHFRRYQPQVSEYLTDAKLEGDPVFSSTQTGSYDMYLPFVEKGIQLLNGNGRMGYIAPSLWPLNNYGEGLRSYLYRTRQLDRWLDFKYYQVFDEAITYTSLQFYSGKPHDAVQYVACPNGEKDVSAVEWDKPHGQIDYSELPDDDAWIFQPDATRSLMQRLSGEFDQLSHEQFTTAIFQGIKTSADPVYVLKRSGPNHYLYSEGDIEQEYYIEDDICRPIAAGSAVKRYADPVITEYLLFPYDLTESPPRLLSPKEMATNFPGAWEYFRHHEQRLRNRESGRFDVDDHWHGFSRPQNMDKQPLPKLLVAGTAPELRIATDPDGSLSTLGGRVYAILPSEECSSDFLMAVLNSSVANFYFTHRARPKSGGFFDAETQNLAPIPIPNVSEEIEQTIAAHARDLRQKHTAHREIISRLEDILQSTQMVDDQRDYTWIWADIRDLEYWKGENQELSGRPLAAWAKQRMKSITEAHLHQLDSMLKPGAVLRAEYSATKLQLFIDFIPAITIFLAEQDADIVRAQWKHICRTTNVTESFNAKKLLKALLSLRTTSQQAIRDQLVELDTKIDSIEADIAETERLVDDLVSDAYRITADEALIVEAARK